MAGGYTVVGKLCGSAITSIIHLALLVCLHRSFANLERPFAQINPHNEAPNQPPWAKSHLRFFAVLLPQSSIVFDDDDNDLHCAPKVARAAVS